MRFDYCMPAPGLYNKKFVLRHYKQEGKMPFRYSNTIFQGNVALFHNRPRGKGKSRGSGLYFINHAGEWLAGQSVGFEFRNKLKK
jgi:hypothetical protein